MRLLIVAALILSGCQSTNYHLTSEQKREIRETRRQCAVLADIDLAALTAPSFDAAQIRETYHWPSAPELGDADVVIRFGAPPGFGGNRTTTTVARHVNGAWHVERRDQFDYPAAPPPPEPGLPADNRPRRQRYPITVTTGVFEPGTAARIDEALSDHCFAREPNFAPSELPLRNGGVEGCQDGATFSMQVERADSVRTFVHSCRTRWRAGDLMRILERANPPGATITQALTPIIYVDENGSDIPPEESPR